MRARAPGKLVLTGAYAVLEGAPAIVVAIDRYAIADASRIDPNPSPEVRQAMREAPAVDASAFFDKKGNKLGLGSSAAVLVAAIAAREAAIDRAAIFERARAAHARAQGGGSGVDVAASTFGGALCYRMGAAPEKVTLPVRFRAYFSGASARTSDLVARVRAARADLGALAEAAEAAARATDARGFVEAAVRTERALEALGRAADLPIVPPAFAELARLAEQEGAAFLPSGAGGGDVGVWLGAHEPSAEFARAASRLERLDLSIDPDGVRFLDGVF